MSHQTDDELLISYYSPDWRGSTLSNMTPTPMMFDGVNAACVESVVQAMNFPPDDPRHTYTLDLSGPICKSMMYEAEGMVAMTGCIFWGGRILPIDSRARIDLLVDVIHAKFATNRLAWEALRLCDGRPLAYRTSSLDDRLSIPSDILVDTLSSILADIRAGSLPVPP